MPRPDPAPTPRASTISRFKRAMAWMTLLAVVVAATAMIFVAYGDRELHLHMLVATGLGVFFTVLLGTGLMLLVFLSADWRDDTRPTRPAGKLCANTTSRP